MHKAKSAFKKTFFSSRGLIFVLLTLSFLCIQTASAANQNPQVSLLSPRGGQSFTAGQKMTIRWNQTNVDSITIGLKTQSGIMEWIESDYKVNINNKTGSYEWTIPVISSPVDNLQVELIAYHTGVGSAVSDSGPFTIKGISNANEKATTTPLNQNQVNVANMLNVISQRQNPQSQIAQNTVPQPMAQNIVVAPVAPLTSADAYKAVVKVKTFTLSDYSLLAEIGEGSGVIINQSGLVLTNDHVVSLRSSYDNSEYDTTFQICLTTNVDEKPSCDYLAKLIARDEDKDIALLQIVNNQGKNDSTAFPYLTLSQTDSTQVNDAVTAIGYPSSGEDTITTTNGIISGKTEEYGNTWIKTDAAVSFGSSGGAAINSQGQVIGITTQVAGELGYLLNSASIFDWVETNKNLSPKNSALLSKLADFAKKLKTLETSNQFVQTYLNFSLTKPADWNFEQSSEQELTISKQIDPDSGYVLVHLFKSPYLTSLNDVKPMLLRYFNENGISSIIKYVKEKEVKINNSKGKFVTLSIKGKMYNSYVFPDKEYLVWLEYSYGKNDKDKKIIDGIINSFKISADKTKFTEVHKYTNVAPKFSLTTNADWAINKGVSKISPLAVRSKKTREAFVKFTVNKIDEAAKGLSNEEFINAKRDEINSNNQITGLVDYKAIIDKTVAHFKLNSSFKDVMYLDATEKTISDNKILAFDREYYIKIGDNILDVNLTVYTDNKKIFDKALVDFNKMLSTLALK